MLESTTPKDGQLDSRRGWFAQYQLRCDMCGRFVRPGSPGSSWVNVPHSDVSSGDERERCATCTEKHGPAECAPYYVKEFCCGVVPKSGAPAND